MKIVRFANPEQYQFDIILFTNERRYYDDEFESYGKIFRIPPISKSKVINHFEYYIQGYRYYKKLKKIIACNGPYDVIHCHNYFMSSYCLKAARDSGIEIRIAHSHNPKQIGSREYVLRNLFDIKMKKKIQEYATCCVACSTKAAEYMFDKPETAVIIPNSIDVKVLKCETDRYRTFDKEEVKLLCVGRLSTQKNQKMCVEILYLLRKNGINAFLTIMGNVTGEDGKAELERCNKLIKKNSMEKYVKYKDGCGDVIKEMRENDIFLMPSVYEGFGIVLLEAQSMGMYCIASEAVPKEASAGMVVFCELVQEKWCKKILEYYNSKNHERVFPNLSFYSLENIIPKYLDIYQGGNK
ncbi:glycosyltransferase [Clostridium perfringens]|nr:glycosyltransferase [Clostridium perfringens]